MSASSRNVSARISGGTTPANTTTMRARSAASSRTSPANSNTIPARVSADDRELRPRPRRQAAAFRLERVTSASSASSSELLPSTSRDSCSRRLRRGTRAGRSGGGGGHPSRPSHNSTCSQTPSSRTPLAKSSDNSDIAVYMRVCAIFGNSDNGLRVTVFFAPDLVQRCRFSCAQAARLIRSVSASSATSSESSSSYARPAAAASWRSGSTGPRASAAARAGRRSPSGSRRRTRQPHGWVDAPERLLPLAVAGVEHLADALACVLLAEDGVDLVKQEGRPLLVD
jgi:hypothetical protein